MGLSRDDGMKVAAHLRSFTYSSKMKDDALALYINSQVGGPACQHTSLGGTAIVGLAAPCALPSVLSWAGGAHCQLLQSRLCAVQTKCLAVTVHLRLQGHTQSGAIATV